MNVADLIIDLTVIESGEWIGADWRGPIPGMPGIELFTRGSRNSDWKALENRLLRSKARNSEKMFVPPEYRTLSNSAQDSILNQCLLDTALKDWRGFDEPYSYEKAGKLIYVPEFRLFRDGLIWAAGQVGRHKPVAHAEIAPAEIIPVPLTSSAPDIAG